MSCQLFLQVCQFPHIPKFSIFLCILRLDRRWQPASENYKYIPRPTRSPFRGTAMFTLWYQRHSHVHALVAYKKETTLIRRHVKKHIAFREVHTQRQTVQEIVPVTANENRRALADSSGFRKISKDFIEKGHVF